jgi:hypothetical protein
LINPIWATAAQRARGRSFLHLNTPTKPPLYVLVSQLQLTVSYTGVSAQRRCTLALPLGTRLPKLLNSATQPPNCQYLRLPRGP